MVNFPRVNPQQGVVLAAVRFLIHPKLSATGPPYIVRARKFFHPFASSPLARLR